MPEIDDMIAEGIIMDEEKALDSNGNKPLPGQLDIPTELDKIAVQYQFGDFSGSITLTDKQAYDLYLAIRPFI